MEIRKDEGHIGLRSGRMKDTKDGTQEEKVAKEKLSHSVDDFSKKGFVFRFRCRVRNSLIDFSNDSLNFCERKSDSIVKK